MTEPVVVIVGRPNVGKSTLFNRLLRRRQAIVDKKEGITRDRIYGSVEWGGVTFTLIDTGGYIPMETDVMDAAVRHQIELAIAEGDLLLFMVDGRNGITSSDEVLADLVRKSNKRHLLIINKIDNIVQEQLKSEFFSLGFDEMITISALSGRNTGDLLDLIIHKLEGIKKKRKDKVSEGIRIAIVGMPNVGKSSVTNALLRQEKIIVTDIPGTTRDSIDSTLKYYGKTFILVDTAGLKKKSRLQDNIEYYSIVRTWNAIDNSHIVLVILDAVKGFGRQDQHIVRRVIDSGKGLILVVNKWDLVKKETKTQEDYKNAIKRLFKAMDDYPILFISAKTKQRLSKLLPEAERVFGLWSQKIPTSTLNQIIKQATERYQPPAEKGKNIKIKYVTQVSQSPPRFALFCNFPQLISKSYQNYLENQLRAHLNLNGVPVRLSFRKS